MCPFGGVHDEERKRNCREDETLLAKGRDGACFVDHVCAGSCFNVTCSITTSNCNSEKMGECENHSILERYHIQPDIRESSVPSQEEDEAEL
jgi:hypothetical protein